MNAAHGSAPTWAFRKDVVHAAGGAGTSEVLRVSPDGVFHYDPPPAPQVGSDAWAAHARARGSLLVWIIRSKLSGALRAQAAKGKRNR